MSGSVYDQVKDLVCKADNEGELMEAFGKCICLLALESDATIEELAEQKHRLDTHIQYVDENIESGGVTYDEVD